MNDSRLDFGPASIAVPQKLGRSVLRDYPLVDIAQYIDWTRVAPELHDDARAFLQAIIDERLFTANGVFALWPAHSEGDAIVVFGDEGRTQVLARLTLPRQSNMGGRSFADFVAPLGSQVKDYVGGFALTAGLGAEELARRFELEGDDDNARMTALVAERLTQAFAERLHLEVRRQWSYGLTEKLSFGELFAGRFRGIRPSYGSAAGLDAGDRSRVLALLGARELDIELRSAGTMIPAASACGLYFAHPEARYFAADVPGASQ